MNLTKWLEAKNLKQRELSRRLGYSSNGPLSAVVRGDTPVPADKVPDWADALELTGPERQQFIDECAAECLPAWAWERLIAAESSLANLLARAEALESSQSTEKTMAKKKLPRDIQEDLKDLLHLENRTEEERFAALVGKVMDLHLQNREAHEKIAKLTKALKKELPSLPVEGT